MRLSHVFTVLIVVCVTTIICWILLYVTQVRKLNFSETKQRYQEYNSAVDISSNNNDGKLPIYDEKNSLTNRVESWYNKQERTNNNNYNQNASSSSSLYNISKMQAMQDVNTPPTKPSIQPFQNTPQQPQAKATIQQNEENENQKYVLQTEHQLHQQEEEFNYIASQRKPIQNNNVVIQSQNYTNITNFTRTIPIVVFVLGELGNFLDHIAFAYYLQLELKYKYNIINTKLYFGLDRTKLSAQNDIKQCFPKISNLLNNTISSQQVSEYLNQQKEWLGMNNDGILQTKYPIDTIENIHTKLDFFASLIVQNESIIKKYNNTTPPPSPFIPFLRTRSMVLDYAIDTYYEEIGDLFEFDYDKCCNVLPHPKETVWHFRNFLLENSLKQRGPIILAQSAHLSPKETATQLFHHLQSGDQVAIATRFPNSPLLQSYINAIQEQYGNKNDDDDDDNITIRVMSNHSGVQDFCFVRKTQQHAIGMSRSTFFRWATWYSNASHVHYYAIDSPYTKLRPRYLEIISPIAWNNLPNASSRLEYSLYPTPEMKEIEENGIYSKTNLSIVIPLSLSNLSPSLPRSKACNSKLLTFAEYIQQQLLDKYQIQTNFVFHVFPDKKKRYSYSSFVKRCFQKRGTFQLNDFAKKVKVVYLDDYETNSGNEQKIYVDEYELRSRQQDLWLGMTQSKLFTNLRPTDYVNNKNNEKLMRILEQFHNAVLDTTSSNRMKVLSNSRISLPFLSIKG